MKITETGFAAVNILTKPPHIMVWTISDTAKGVREKTGENWNCPFSYDPRLGWKDAMKDGARVRKVKIETI